MKISSKDNKNSRYVLGGNTELTPNFLGWWERYTFTRRDDDIKYTIPTKYAFRPDLVAYEFYGKATYMWLVLQYNNIFDVYEEFSEGTQITLMAPQRVFFEIGK